HPPFVVPAPYNTMYDPAEGPDFARCATKAEEVAIHPLHARALASTRLKSFVPGATGTVSELSEAEFRTIRALYWGMITEVDDQLGRIWQALKDAGAWDNTVIVLTSDHAEMMGDHMTLGKGGFFDGSYHLPL